MVGQGRVAAFLFPASFRYSIDCMIPSLQLTNEASFFCLGRAVKLSRKGCEAQWRNISPSPLLVHLSLMLNGGLASNQFSLFDCHLPLPQCSPAELSAARQGIAGIFSNPQPWYSNFLWSIGSNADVHFGAFCMQIAGLIPPMTFAQRCILSTLGVLLYLIVVGFVIYPSQAMPCPCCPAGILRV